MAETFVFKQTGAELQAIIDAVETIDQTPTAGSKNPVESGGVAAALEGVETALQDVDEALDGVNGRLDGVDEALAGKQATLVSAENIKTINGQSILGSGNLTVGDANAVRNLAGSASDYTTVIKAGNDSSMAGEVRLENGSVKAQAAGGSVEVNASGVALQAGNSGAPNAKVTYNGSEIATKAQVDAVSDVANAAADKTEVDAALALKADKSDTYTKAQVDAAIAAIDVSSQIAGKADKVANAVAGDFAGLDDNGNLTDSGKKAADFATAAQGAKADSAVQSVTVGTTTTSASGGNASVINSGTAQNPVLDFTIPRGEKGDQGEKGDTVIIGGEDTYTLYNTRGGNTNGAMTQAATSSALASIDSQLTDNTETIIDDLEWQSGFIWKDGTGVTSNASFKYCKIPVAGMESIRIYGRGNSGGVVAYVSLWLNNVWVRDVVVGVSSGTFTYDETLTIDGSFDSVWLTTGVSTDNYFVCVVKTCGESFDFADTFSGDTDADFAIADVRGNEVARFVDGHIVTKNFDSRGVENTKRIVCIGTSLTQGQSGMSEDLQNVTVNQYPSILAGMITDIEVINSGAGGEKTQEIFAREGLVLGVLTTSITLKGDGTETLLTSGAQSPSTITLVDSYASRVISYLLMQGSQYTMAQESSVYVNGVRCTLTRSNDNIYIKRNDVVSYDLTLAQGTELVFCGAEKKSNDIYIIESGFNDLSFDADVFVEQIKNAVAKIPSNKYLVCGIHTIMPNYSKNAEFLSANEKLKREFGSRYVDTIGYMSSYQSFHELGITPTTDADLTQEQIAQGVYSDTYAITNGFRPSSYCRFFYLSGFESYGVDFVHCDYLGYYCVAKCVYDRLRILGWI